MPLICLDSTDLCIQSLPLQNVAVLRDETARDDAPDSSNRSTTSHAKSKRRRPIEKIQYDYFHRPLGENQQNDGNWQPANPVDKTTGLWYDPEPYSKNGADWADLVPKFLQHGYSSALGLKSQANHPLLMVERSYNPPPLRQQLLEILMEEMSCPAVFFARDATLACYACGRTTSTVVDVGYYATTVTPVYDGYVEQKGIRKCPIAAEAMDELALSHLQSLAKHQTVVPLWQVKYPHAQRHPAFHRLALLQIAKDSRESGAGQSVNAAASKTLHVPSVSYTLPDGQTVDVPSMHRFAVADMLLGRSHEDHADGGGGGGGQGGSNGSASAEEMMGDSPSPRQQAVTACRKEFSTMLLNLSHGNENESDDEDDDAKQEQQQLQSNAGQNAKKYTEATAVGISSRRTTRGGAAAIKKQKEQVFKVPFSNRQLQRACASYFQSQMDQWTASPIAGMVCDAAFKCDRDQQASLLGNVVLGGGGACIGPTDQAVPDLLRDQIETMIHTHTPGWRVKLLSPGIQERAICSWLGGSILGSLGTFHDMWITKAEYDEWGSAVVNRKCP